VKERRGTVRRLTGLAEGVAAAARRRQRDRSPRALVYDEAGHPSVLPSDSPDFDAVVAAAQRLIEVADSGETPAQSGSGGARPPSYGGVSVPESRPEAGDQP
jgi:hypothetical protein